jgi:hypothetical protein
MGLLRDPSASVIPRSVTAIASIAVLCVLVVGSASGARGAASPGVDLEVRLGTELASVVARGGALRVELTVANTGRTRGSSTPARVYLSRDRRPGRGDIELDSPLRLGGLAPGAMRRRAAVVRIPKDAPLGRWLVIVCAELPASSQGDRPGCGASESRVRVVKAPALEPLDGGADYYGRFSNGFPTSASYFPIGVWLESVVDRADLPKDKAAGINTYVAITADSNLANVRANGMKVLLQQSEWLRSPSPGSETAGWEIRDEIDMQMSPDEGYAEVLRIKGALPGDRRLRFNNYGKGVMFWETDAQAARYVNAVDLVSNDVYWFTDPTVCGASEGGALFVRATRDLTTAECRRGSNYGAVVRRMRRLVAPAGSKPVWAFVEVGQPFANAALPPISPAQVRSAVWHSLIAGARGVIYFNHSFGGPCPSQHVLREGCYAAIRAAVTSLNGQIRSLAPALNGASIVSGWTSGKTTRAMLKAYRGDLYLFAGSAENVSAAGSFSIPCAGDAPATVIGENRTIPLRDGSFTDTFGDGNAIHVYRIRGAASCGLA